jgi:hypothetical protein
MALIDPGLCKDCRHANPVRSAHDAVYYLCRLSFDDARFPKYPRLPVLFCEGYDRAEAHAELRDGTKKPSATG